MRILYSNKLTIDNYLSATGSNSNYPAQNLVNPILTTTWRSLAIDVAQAIVFDAGVGNTITANCVFISGHNLSAAATVKFQMHTADAWGAPDLNETITYRATHMYKYFTSTAKRYARLEITDVANTDGYIEVGFISAGTYLQISPSSNLPFKVSNQRNDVVQVTDQGCVYGSPGVSKRIFSLDFANVSNTFIESMRTVYTTVGNYTPIYFANFDETFTHHDIVYGRIANDLEENCLGDKRNNYSLVIEEAK